MCSREIGAATHVEDIRESFANLLFAVLVKLFRRNHGDSRFPVNGDHDRGAFGSSYTSNNVFPFATGVRKIGKSYGLKVHENHRAWFSTGKGSKIRNELR